MGVPSAQINGSEQPTIYTVITKQPPQQCPHTLAAPCVVSITQLGCNPYTITIISVSRYHPVINLSTRPTRPTAKLFWPSPYHHFLTYLLTCKHHTLIDSMSLKHIQLTVDLKSCFQQWFQYCNRISNRFSYTLFV